jgi:hypothetical protein
MGCVPEGRLIAAASDRLAGFLLLEGHGYIAIGREAHLIALDVGDEAEVDEVVMSLVAVRAAVGFGQLDPAAFDPVDGADMNTVCPYHFHMLFDAHAIHLIDP